MNWKTTATLAVIVLVGWLYITFIETKGPTTKTIQEGGKKVFAAKDLSDHIDQIAIGREDGEFKFERQGDDTDALWRMSEPMKVRADKSEVKAISSALEDVTIKNSVGGEGETLNLADYGLDKPRATVTFKALDDEYTLLIGKESPTDDDEIFVKNADVARVYLVSDSIYDKVKKSQNEFRDKKVAHIEKDDVEGLTIAWKADSENKNVQAAKEKGEWMLKAPVEDYADKDKVEGLVDKVKDLKIDKEDFYAEGTDDPAKYGLDAPELTVTVVAKAEEGAGAEGKGTVEYDIIFGKAVDGKDDKVYAKRKDEDTIFGVKDDILDDLQVKEVKDVRSTDFGKFDDDDVNKVEIKLAASVVVVEKKKEKDDDDDSTSSDEKWKLTKPKEMEVEKSAVEDLIDDLEGAKIDEFVTDTPEDADLEKYGLKQPAATITVYLKDGGGSAAYEIGSLHEEDEQKFYARRAGSKNVYLVKKEDLREDILSGYLLFKDKEVVKFSKSDALKVIVEQADKTVVATKKEDDWQLTQPVTAPADSGRIDSLLWAVNSLDAVRFAEEAPKDLAKYGLDKPAVKLTIEVEEEVEDEDDEEKENDDDAEKEKKKVKRSITLLLGQKVEDEDEYYAKLTEGENKDFVFTVKKYDYEKVTAEFHDREVVDVTKSDVEEISLKYKDETITCKKDAEKDEWKITSPREAEGRKSEIEDLLDELDGLDAEKLASYKADSGSELEPFGLREPELTVTVRLKEKKEKVILVGKMIEEDDKKLYHVKVDDKDAVFLVREKHVKEIRKKMEDLEKVEEKKDEEAKEGDPGEKPAKEAEKEPEKKENE